MGNEKEKVMEKKVQLQSETHTSSTFAAKCSFLNSTIQHTVCDLLTVTSLKNSVYLFLSFCSVSTPHQVT